MDTNIMLEIEYWDREQRTCTIRVQVPNDYLAGDDTRTRALLACMISRRKGGLHRIKRYKEVQNR